MAPGGGDPGPDGSVSGPHEGAQYPHTDDDRGPGPVSSAVRVIRRALLALSFAGLIAAILRLRGSGGTPPQGGGWEELPFTEQR